VTVHAYLADARSFARWLDTTTQIDDLTNVSQSAVEGFLARRLPPRTRRRHWHPPLPVPAAVAGP